MDQKYDLADALDGIAKERLHDPAAGPIKTKGFTNKDDYEHHRDRLKAREGALSFDYICKRGATETEKKANQILQGLRAHDNRTVYGKEPSVPDRLGQQHQRFMGDRFLTNVDIINKTKLYEIAKKMPKGAHLHIHFNANLEPSVLLEIAEREKRMFIKSDIPLLTADDFHRCRIQFKILNGTDVATQGRELDVFSSVYPAPMPDQDYRWMKFDTFRHKFERHNTAPTHDVRRWLHDKLLFHEEEAHGCLQTQEGVWDLFNARTQMMKGLFNYEAAYRGYTQQCLEDFAKDGIQYAEIRVNFMQSNQLLTGEDANPAQKEDANERILKIIIEECETFKKENSTFAGIKIIYCVPRSFAPSGEENNLEERLAECLKFKKTQAYGDYIAGFDLVGEEGAKKWPLKKFVPQLLQFKQDCHTSGVEIPFLFHCGETLDIGSDTDGNLYDALLLGAKRIGHGYALPRHPFVLEQMKRDNVCVELCPISNEILGLTPRVSGHAMYNLLANNVHCTVNTDNGTFFRSKLSHDFYQVFAGKQDMTLFGWKQLALWSIEHSCMDEKERKDVMIKWEKRWAEFCAGIVRDYSKFVDGTS